MRKNNDAYYKTNVKEESLWKVDSGSAIQEIPRILWTQNVYCSIHKSPQLKPVHNQMNPVHILTLSVFKIHLMLSSCKHMSRSSKWFLSFTPSE
jgi:hypothetical protein